MLHPAGARDHGLGGTFWFSPQLGACGDLPHLRLVHQPGVPLDHVSLRAGLLLNGCVDATSVAAGGTGVSEGAELGRPVVLVGVRLERVELVLVVVLGRDRA